MRDFQPQADPSREAPAVGHETSDVNARGIALFVVVLVVTVAVGQIGLGRVMSAYARRTARIEASRSPHFRTAVEPPEPRIVGEPAVLLRQYRAEEARQLGSYGWVDREAGVARIPIDRAIDIVARTGLPKAQPRKPGTDPGARPAQPDDPKPTNRGARS